MRRSMFVTAAAAGVTVSLFVAGVQPRARAHCEVPCGVYDDHARVVQMYEDTTTIGRAVEKINGLAGQHDPQALNQAARWIATKEDHATRIQHTIAQYFLTQRVKPAPAASQAYDDYVTRLVQHHQVMVAAMKAKQSADPQRVEELRAAIMAIEGYYPSSK